ncbi:MAG: GNAT family N-acetyltransferase [Myxococcales bacterium]|nr:GNAT family N-acetyltransferase [Myxococcales bacterium]
MPLPADMELIERQNGYSLYAFEGTTPPATEPMMAMMGAAWGHDYDERAIFRYDEPYLRWLLPKAGSVGVLVTDSQNQWVGCIIGVHRELRWHGKPLSVLYSTALSVHPAHRGKRLAMRMLALLHQLGRERCGAGVLAGILDSDASGEPTVAAVVAEQGWLLLESPPLTVWGCTADLLAMEAYEPLQGLARIALLPGLRSRAEFKTRRADRAVRLEAVSPQELEPAELPEAPLVTLNCGALSEMYGQAHPERSGTLRAPDYGVSACYHVLTLCRPGAPDCLLGQVQLIYGGSARSGALLPVLRAVTARMLDLGCASVTLMDTGLVAGLSLIRAGYTPLPRSVRFILYGDTSELSGKSLDRPLHVELM